MKTKQTVATVCHINITGQATPPEITAMISVKDITGSYTIPYIQSDRELRVNVDFSDQETVSANLILEGKEFRVSKKVEKPSPSAFFTTLPPGEFTLDVEWLKSDGSKLSETVYKGIGVGAVLAAIGDSLTEGYHGVGFIKESLDLKASDFPAEAVSMDGRNFPQFSPTTFQHKPTVNCFQSWMTALNDKLSEEWKMPVFIANEGWGGYTAANYLAMMRGNSGGWKDRMHLLQPNTWLIHLGVNDERQKVAPADFAKSMRGIVGILIDEYNADPSQIFLAYPSYDYAAGAEAILRSYIVEIDKIISDLNLRKGPDFFEAFSKDKEKWYGNDPVHPGIEGMNLMAELWAAKLAPNVPAPKKACLFMQNIKNGKKQTIVTYGTSLTAGGAWVGALQNAMYAKYPGLARVINSGEGAKWSTWGLENLQERVLSKKPDAVFIEFSVNDAYLPYKMTPADCKANIDTMVARILKEYPDCEIILMVMNPMVDIHSECRPELEKFNDIYRATAKEKGFLLIDHYPAWLKILETGRKEFDRLVPDGAHPSPEGCNRIVTPKILKEIGM
ncbi:MAG: SGNH/GDSL hydrolase family protein [Victivallales bacterium]